MDSASERQRRRGLEAVAKNILHPLPDDDVQLPTDAAGIDDRLQDRLWDYALGLLEPAEERQIIRLLACSPAAEAALAGIRRAMTQAAVANPIEAEQAETSPIVQQALERIEATLETMGLGLPSMAGVVVNLGDRLVSAWEGTFGGGKGLAALGTVLEDEQQPEEPALQRIDIGPLHGLAASIIRVSADRLDIEVTASDPPLAGSVRLVRLVASAGKYIEEETGIDAKPTEDGRARLEDCPRGVWRIVASDGRELVVCLETGTS